MTRLDIAHQRLHNQRIARGEPGSPDCAVAWMGALQAQDYPNAKWAIGLRSHGATDATVERAISDARIVRTWLNRGALHFVAAPDARWMLELLAPGIISGRAGRHRQLGLDAATFALSFDALARALQGSRPLTRAGTFQVLARAGVSTEGQRGYHILGRAALEGLICFGPMQGKEQTFVWLDEWVPPGMTLDRDAALAELAWRYVASHGPAALPDFAWWSGLPMRDARAALELAAPRLHQEMMDGEPYWLAADGSATGSPSPAVHLLPAFDEYLLGYSSRDAVLDPQTNIEVVSSNGVFRPVLVIDGQVTGIWKRTIKRDRVDIRPIPFRPLSESENQALVCAANRFGTFLARPVSLS